jgi:serine O-acetyltransferase
MKLLKFYGTEIHPKAKISNKCRFVHSPFGTVITDRVIVEDDVRLYHGITLGKAEVHLPDRIINNKIGNIIVKKGAIIGTGATILIKEGDLVIGKNTIIGANSVLTKSTGDDEIWAGIPAKKVNDRSDEYMI